MHHQLTMGSSHFCVLPEWANRRLMTAYKQELQIYIYIQANLTSIKLQSQVYKLCCYWNIQQWLEFLNSACYKVVKDHMLSWIRLVVS